MRKAAKMYQNEINIFHFSANVIFEVAEEWAKDYMARLNYGEEGLYDSIEVEEGVQAIIYLQAVAGIEETLEKASAGWFGMNEHEKNSTLDIYRRMFAMKHN